MLLHRTRATMAAFVTSLQAYVMTEVLEAEWAGFSQQLDSSPNMDDLIGKPLRLMLDLSWITVAAASWASGSTSPPECSRIWCRYHIRHVPEAIVLKCGVASTILQNLVWEHSLAAPAVCAHQGCIHWMFALALLSCVVGIVATGLAYGLAAQGGLGDQVRVRQACTASSARPY